MDKIVSAILLSITCAILQFDYANAANPDLVITFKTDADTYYLNEVVNIRGNVSNSNGTGVRSQITLNVCDFPCRFPLQSNSTIYSAHFLTLPDGSFMHDGFRMHSNGTFQIAVNASSGNSNDMAFRKIFGAEQSNFGDLIFHPIVRYPFWITVASGVAVSVMSLVGKWPKDKKKDKEEDKEKDKEKDKEDPWFTTDHRRGRLFLIAKFVYLSGLAYTPIIFLTFVPGPIGVGSISIVRDIQPNEIQWLINIGGIKIPFLVVVLGLLGAHIRYLWNLFNLTQEERLENHEKLNRRISRRTSELDLYDVLWGALALFFLAPLVAVAFYFILVNSGMDNLLTYGFFSIAIGLMMEDAIRIIRERFARMVPVHPNEFQNNVAKATVAKDTTVTVVSQTGQGHARVTVEADGDPQVNVVYSRDGVADVIISPSNVKGSATIGFTSSLAIKWRNADAANDKIGSGFSVTGSLE